MLLTARNTALLGAVGLALANLGRIPIGELGGRAAPFVLADVATALAWAFLIAGVWSGRIRIVMDDLVGAVAAFLVVALVSTGLAIRRYDLGVTASVGTLAYLIRWVFYFGWYPFVAWCLSGEDSERTVRYFDRAIVIVAVFGIFQSAFLPGFAQMIHDGGGLPVWDPQGRRLVSSFLDPNYAGIFIAVALLYRFSRLAERLPAHPATLILLGVALVLTLSRSALVGLAAGLVVIVVARGVRLRVIAAFVVGALLLLPFIPIITAWATDFNKLGIDASAAQRFVAWIRAAILIREHPFFGIGFNATTHAQAAHSWRPVGGADVSLDGGLIFITAMTGAVGLFFYLRMLWRVFRYARLSWRNRALPPGDRAHATFCVAALAAVVAHSFFVNSILLSFMMMLLWISWARLAHIAADARSLVPARPA